MNQTTRKTLEQVVQESGRYPLEAFMFVREGLDYTVERVHLNYAQLPEGQRHVNGQQLCEGLREFAIRRYGLMAKAVLNHWRIFRTEDFGNIVFLLVENKIMQKTEEDDLRDFFDVYDFDEVFTQPARPRRQRPPAFRLDVAR